MTAIRKPLVMCEFCKLGFDPITDRGSYSHDWATYKCSRCNDLGNCAAAELDAKSGAADGARDG